MTQDSSTKMVVRFGTFELDQVAGELRKNGRKVRLQDQPIRLLGLLVQHPGEVISREELREKLWPSDTFVDFDNSLNTAASKLREALGDSVSSPRFIETLPRRGYRFLASVHGVENEAVVPSPLHGGLNGEQQQGAILQESEGPERSPDRRSWRQMAWPLTSVLLLAVSVVLWMRTPPPMTDARLRRYALRPAEGFSSAVISPNGLHVAYVSTDSLWIQDLDRDNPRQIAATSADSPLAWSPDSRQIVYVLGKELREIDVAGGPSSVVCDLRGRYSLLGLTWSPDKRWVIFNGGTWDAKSLQFWTVYRVPSTGGEPAVLLDVDQYRYAHWQTVDSTKFASLSLAARRSAGVPGGWQVISRSEESEEDSVLASGLHPVYSPTGHVIYEALDGSGLWAVPFSPETASATGKPFPIREGASQPSVSLDGTLVYTNRGTSQLTQLWWRDRQGKKLNSAGQPQDRIGYPEISPDGTSVAVAANDAGKQQIWIHEADRPVKILATRNTAQINRAPLWLSPREIIFSSAQLHGRIDIFRTMADGSTEEQLLYSTDQDAFASDISPDGNSILADVNASDVWTLHRQADNSFQAEPFLTTRFEERAAKFSPDGSWVAYVSDESGGYEVYVCRFPECDQKRRVSEDGGGGPRWSGDGRKLYYVQGSFLMETDVTQGAELSISPERGLFSVGGLERPGGSVFPHYDVAVGGDILISEPAGDRTIRVVQNWFAEFQDVPR